MKQIIINRILIVFNLFTILSCTINDTEKKVSEKLTIEGQIREDEFAEIFLTNSLDFEGIIDSLTVAKSVESKAKVTLSDGEITEVLTLKRDNSRFPFLFYRSNLIKGERNRKYDLTVFLGGKEFSSNTTVPEDC